MNGTKIKFDGKYLEHKIVKSGFQFFKALFCKSKGFDISLTMYLILIIYEFIFVNLKLNIKLKEFVNSVRHNFNSI